MLNILSPAAWSISSAEIGISGTHEDGWTTDKVNRMGPTSRPRLIYTVLFVESCRSLPTMRKDDGSGSKKAMVDGDRR